MPEEGFARQTYPVQGERLGLGTDPLNCCNGATSHAPFDVNYEVDGTGYGGSCVLEWEGHMR